MHTGQRVLAGLALIAFGLLEIGCSSARTWTYQVAPFTDRQRSMEKSLAVPPLNDLRRPENDNRVLMYLIPLMPYGWQDLEQPEGVNIHITSGLWQFKPTEDIAKALAAEIHSHNIFRESFFTFRESDADYVLRGSLTSTKYDGKMFSYGLSAYGPVLWFVGFPSGSLMNRLAFKLELVERQSNKHIWEQDYSFDYDAGVFWLYSMPENFYYDKALKQLVPKILADLEASIKKGAQQSHLAPPAQ